MRSIYIILLAIHLVLASEKNITSPLASNCGGNCPSKDCESCPCDVPTQCALFSGWDQKCCQCIVHHESAGNANAANENSNGSYDVGLWQINSGNWPACSGGAAPCSISANLGCAQYVWKQGGGTFSQWATCTACNCCSNPPTNTNGQTTNGPSTTQSSYSGAAIEGTPANNGGEGAVPYEVNVIYN